MIERVTSISNPNFFLLKYNLANFEVTDFLVIPKHFFDSAVIEKLNRLHPENKHVKDKISQQLQILRDKNYLEFIGGGIYRIR